MLFLLFPDRACCNDLWIVVIGFFPCSSKTLGRRKQRPWWSHILLDSCYFMVTYSHLFLILQSLMFSERHWSQYLYSFVELFQLITILIWIVRPYWTREEFFKANLLIFNQTLRRNMYVLRLLLLPLGPQIIL